MPRIQLTDAYHALFYEETKEQLVMLEQLLIQLEKDSLDQETIQAIFRIAHSLKGAAATLQLTDLLQVSHVMEDVLTAIKKKDLTVTKDVINVLLDALDTLKLIHEVLIHSEEPLETIHTIVAALGRFLEEKNDTWSGVRVLLAADAELPALKAYMVVQALMSVGSLKQIEPEDYEFCEDDAFSDGIKVIFESPQAASTVMELLDTLTDIQLVEPHGQKQTMQTMQTEPSGESKLESRKLPSDMKPLNDSLQLATAEKTSVRVSIQKINQLINLVSELIVDKESIHDIAKELKTTYGKDPQVNRLVEVFNHLHFIGSELQEIALSTRMLPLETLFAKYPRMVRDVAAVCGKEVHFVVEGAEQGIDRGMIEELSDPITHLLRNAIDHGIESVEERVAAGKAAGGTIKLSASQGDNHILIIIEDDGKGIDIRKIQKKAIERGMVTLEESEFISGEEWLEYIFEPGFSTSHTVNEVSGRGVGLDIVKSNISKLSGQIEVKSESGKGTRFIIKLPLTLAIMNAMMVYEDGCTFAIPVTSIVEIFRLKRQEIKERIHRTGYSDVLHWRDMAIPLVALSDLFDLETELNEEKLFIIVLGAGERKTALVVRDLLGEQEIVIKSIGDFIGKDKLFGALKGISGVSILGDGSLAHILDVAAVMH